MYDIPFPDLLDDLQMYAQYSYREIKDQKALRVYNKCRLRGKAELARKIALKYGRAIDRAAQSDMAMASVMLLTA
jgi:hypothetical protein